MKRLLVGAAVVVGLIALFLASIMVASEGAGEIVVLRTTGADGSAEETRLWVVDYEGSAWLRAGVPSSAWLSRLEAEPRVTVTRAGQTGEFRAVAVRDPAIRDRVHALMRGKYGWADRWVSLIRDGSRSVAVRLDPVR